MKPEELKITELKVGEIYNVRVKVCYKEDSRVSVRAIDKNGNDFCYCSNWFAAAETAAFSPITPAPKYDPCRKYRKGDIVEPSEINGRLPQELRGCYRYEVITGEGEMTNPLYVAVKPLLKVNYKHLSELHVNAAFLKLVTPVEELGPYKVNHDKELELFEVVHYEMGDDTIAEEGKLNKIVRTIYWYGKSQWDRTEAEAKAAAEAECSRLNEEYRKEQK